MARGIVSLVAVVAAFAGCDADESQQRLVLQTGPVQPRRVAFSQQEPARILVVEKSGIVSLWNAPEDERPVKTATLFAAAIDAAFLPDGKGIVTGGFDGAVRWWDESGSLIRTSETLQTGSVRAIAVGPRLLASGGDGGEAHVDAIESLAFSPNGELVASGSRNDAIRVWSLDGKQRSVLQGLRDIVGTIDVSPGSDLVVAGSAPHEIEIWTVDGSKKTPPIVAHQGHVFAVAFSPRGDSFASGGRDGLVRLWNLDGKPRGEALAGHRAAVRAIAFALDGSFLASGGEDGQLRIWPLSSGAESKTILVGAPIEQLGARGSFLWVRARGDLIRFFDEHFRPTATMALLPEGPAVFTTNGWYSGPGATPRTMVLFDGDRRLDDGKRDARRSPQRVVGAIRGVS